MYKAADLLFSSMNAIIDHLFLQTTGTGEIQANESYVKVLSFFMIFESEIQYLVFVVLWQDLKWIMTRELSNWNMLLSAFDKNTSVWLWKHPNMVFDLNSHVYSTFNM